MRIFLRDLSLNTDYVLQLRANDGQTASDWSRKFELSTAGDTIAPSPASSLSWVVEGTAFKGTWTAPTTNSDSSALNDFQDFEVKIYSPAAPATIATYYTAASRFDLTFERNLNSFGTPRAAVTIEVRARDNSGNLSTVVSSTATNPAPSNVTGFTVAGISDACSMRWTAVTDTDLKYYRVYQGTSAGVVTNLVYTGPSTSFVYDTLATTLQYFEVFAVDVFGTQSAVAATGNATPRSTFSVDTTPPATPTGVTVTTALDTNDVSGSRAYIDASWTAVADTDLQNYSIRYSTSSSGPWEYINVPEGIVTGRINNLKSGTAYYVAVGAVDFVGNASSYANAATFPITTTADTTAPSTPSAPTIAANALQIQVTHDGLKAAGGSLESDLDHFDVYASTTTGFTPGATSLLGQIGNGPAKVASFPVPASASSGTSQTWYAKVIAVDYAGNRSTASAQSSASVPLIAAVNIGDAVITNAKIADLAADKITAGSGIINNLLIKSTLTVDTAGTVQSGNFNDTTKVGWQLANTALKLYDGTVYARALVLKNGENLMPSQYADFEWSAYWYTSFPIQAGHDGGSEVVSVVPTATTAAKYGSQSLSLVRTASAGTYSRAVLTTTSTSTYNIQLEASTDYIVSGWFKTPNASGNKTIAMNLNSASGAVSGSSQVLTADGTWYRFSWVLTTNAATAFNVDVKLFTAGTLYADGIQIEQKLTAETTPSQWRPPSTTTIDGGSIVTGEIRSTATASGLSGQPAWSINTAGAAQFGDVAVRGRLVVGDISNPSGDGTNSKIQSANFSSGSTGWIIRQDGYAEFSNVLIRGGTITQGLVLIYSGTPASGTLRFSIAAASGTDSFSNAYVAGIAAYKTGAVETISIDGSTGLLITDTINTTIQMDPTDVDGLFLAIKDTSNWANALRLNVGGLVSAYNGGTTGNLPSYIALEPGDDDGSPRATITMGENSNQYPVDVIVGGTLIVDQTSLSNGTVADLSVGMTINQPSSSTVAAFRIQQDGTDELVVNNGGLMTTYSGNAYTTFTPTVTGGGSAAFSTRTGWRTRIGNNIFYGMYFVVSTAGSGGTAISITGAINVDRTTRQVLLAHCDGLTAGNNGACTLLSLTGGSGAVWDRLRNSTNGNITGADLSNGGVISITGWFRSDQF